MPEPNKLLQKKILLSYVVFFTLCFFLSWHNGLLLHQVQPPFLYDTIDFTKNVIYNVGLQKYFSHQWFLLLFDGVFILLPWLVLLLYRKDHPLKCWIAAFMMVFNIVYAAYLVAFVATSYANLLGWMMIPFIFVFNKEKSIYYATNFIRYYFLFFFFSVGFWKIYDKGIFNTEQMSSILLFQHRNLLLTSPGSTEATVYLYFIKHTMLSYALLLGACLSQLFFAVGFFTKKFDKILILLFFVFIISDLFLMQINYFSSLVFLIVLFYSKKLSAPESI